MVSKSLSGIPLTRFFRLLIILISGSWTVLRAQSPAFSRLEQLTDRDGLPQSFVSGLVQDENGFVWVATRNGLARFDGLHFKLFQHSIRDTNSLASNTIIWIRKQAPNQIWIEYESGEIDVMDPATERVKHFSRQHSFQKDTSPFTRRGWLVDSDQGFWEIHNTTGLRRFDPRTNTISHYSRKTHGLPSDTLCGLLEDRNRQLWVLSHRGISAFNKKTGRFSHYSIPAVSVVNPVFDAFQEVIDLHERKNGELMWGDRQRLFFFHPVRHSFRMVPLPQPSSPRVLWIRTGPDGRDYLETGGAVYRYDDQNGLVTLFKKGADSPLDARSFLVDRSGLIWIGTNARGIFQLDLTTPAFPAFPNQAGFHQDLLEKELNMSLNRQFSWQSKDQQFSAASYHVRSVYDVHGQLWLGLKETVFRYDPQRQQWTRLPAVPIVTDRNESGIGLKGMTFTASGNLMVVGYNGRILEFNPVSQIWTPFINDERIRKRFGLATLPLDILADPHNLWITTELDGLLSIDLRTRQIQQFKTTSQVGSLPTNQLLSLHPDPVHADRLWIGSYQGLICFNKKNRHCEVFSLQEGLPDNTVYSIQSDRLGKLWLTTNKGLCQFDPVSRQVRVFQTLHGLPGNEFNRFHHFRLPDGRLAFGGTEGWTLFDPTAIKNDHFEPQVAFTELKINNILISPNIANPVLPVPMNALKQLDLSPDQNTLSIAFAGLQFNQPQAMEYRYRLIGYDDDWVLAGHTPLANYTKIPPGTYTLIVNASNTTGQWSPHTQSIQLVINPPWWRTWWAFLGYILFIAGSIWYGLRIYVNRLRLQQVAERREQEAQQLRILDEMKSRFFTNITHDFRTPLTLILSPLEGLIRDLAETSYQKRLESIQRSARQLLSLINQLMDFSKLDANVLTISESRGNISEFTARTVQLFDEETRLKAVELQYKSTVSGDYWFDSSKLERILTNLLGNALKFTPSGGQILVSLEPADGILLTVLDTGVGIPKEKLSAIFDRFFQIESENSTDHPDPVSQRPQPSGTGIGLALVRELILLQQGEIEVTSEPGKGTIFRVRLPYRKAEPTEVLPEPEPAQTALVTETPESNGEQPLVLLVEDNPELADFIADSLPRHYRVGRASNGAQGLLQAYAELPDLVISDVMMPVMDGYAFCQELKQDDRTSHIPVILLTARTAFESRMEGLSRGADDYLTKPFHVQELNVRIHNLLERQRRFREHIRQDLSRPGTADPDDPFQHDSFLQKLAKTLDEKLEDSSFGVEELAQAMGLSRVHLHRKVKTLTGLTSSEVIRNYRLKRATQYLRKGFNSSETAYQVGFDSPAYFTKCFRELYGQTPLEFAQNA